MGPKSKIEENSFEYSFCHGELMAKNGSIRFHREIKKGEAMFVTDRQMDRQTESATKNNRLLG